MERKLQFNRSCKSQLLLRRPDCAALALFQHPCIKVSPLLESSVHCPTPCQLSKVSNMLLNATSVSVSCFVFIAFCGWMVLRRCSRVNKAFPGPPSDPLLGHFRIFPREYPWIQLTEWSKQYGILSWSFRELILVTDKAIFCRIYYGVQDSSQATTCDQHCRGSI